MGTRARLHTGRTMRVVGLLAVMLAGSAHAGAVELTKENFKELVTDSGKAAFVKFLAPW